MTAALSNGGGLSFGVALSDPPLMRSGAPGVLTSQPTHQRPRLGQRSSRDQWGLGMVLVESFQCVGAFLNRKAIFDVELRTRFCYDVCRCGKADTHILRDSRFRQVAHPITVAPHVRISLSPNARGASHVSNKSQDDSYRTQTGTSRTCAFQAERHRTSLPCRTTSWHGEPDR